MRGGRYEIHFRPLQSHSLDESCVFFPFFSPPFFRMLSQHRSNVRPFSFVLFVFFPGCVSSPSSGTHNAQLPLCSNISALLYTSIMWRFATATICYSPCSVHVGGTFLFSHAWNQRKAFCHFCQPSDVTSALEAAPFVPWRPERIHRRDSAPKTGRKTAPRASGDLILTAESGPTAPPVCAVGAAGLLIPTHDQERLLNLHDAEDHISCSHVTVRLFMSYPSLPTRGSMLITPEDVQGGGLFQCKAKSSRIIFHKAPLTP